MSWLLFKDSDARDLGILRATVFSIWFLIIAFTPFTNLALLPVEIFEPLGIFKLIFTDSSSITYLFLSEPFLIFLKSSLLLCTFLCLIGAKPFHWIAVPTVILLFLADGIIKGYSGYVNHAELGVLYGALILSISPSSDGFSFGKINTKRKETPDYTIPILLIAFTLCITYSFVGVHRLLNGGFEQFFNDALLVHLTTNSLNYSKFSFSFGLFIAGSEMILTFFKAGFFIVTLIEISSPFILIYTYLRYLWLFVMIPFHLLSLFAMNIFFWENFVLIFVLFFYLVKKNPQLN